MAKFIPLLIFGYSLSAFASVLHVDEIKTRGLACTGLSAHVETDATGVRQLVVRFKNLTTTLSGEQKEDLALCYFMIPFKVAASQAVRFSDPSIAGKANVAPRVTAKLNFEIAWPHHRGPNFEVGYKTSRDRVTESFQETSPGTELTFECGESTDLLGTVSANLKTGWFYRAARSDLEATEVRLNIEDIPCNH